MSTGSGLAALGMIAAALLVAPVHDAQEIRLAPSEFNFGQAASAGPGTSGIAAIQTIVLKGDPTKPGLYTILLRVPAQTRIAAHRHPDDRIATVLVFRLRQDL